LNEFQAHSDVDKLIGAPNGYYGDECGGQLTRALTEDPNAIILLDELEKAHADVLTVLLQAFDEGRLRSGKGEVVLFPNAIFILTSNLGAAYIEQKSAELQAIHNLDERALAESQLIETRLKRTILEYMKRPELLARIQRTLLFLPMGIEARMKIVDNLLVKFRNDLEVEEKTVTWTEDVLRLLANRGGGARGLENIIEALVQPMLSDHDLRRGQALQLYVAHGRLQGRIQE
jgi:ATP-dependent Clp protease ATP-binding subunit ClpB